MGVDGFRVDAMPYLIEDSSFRDEPLVVSKDNDDGSYNCLDHTRTKNQLETYEIIEHLRAVLDKYTKSDGNTRYFTEICHRSYINKTKK